MIYKQLDFINDIKLKAKELGSKVKSTSQDIWTGTKKGAQEVFNLKNRPMLMALLAGGALGGLGGYLTSGYLWKKPTAMQKILWTLINAAGGAGLGGVIAAGLNSKKELTVADKVHTLTNSSPKVPYNPKDPASRNAWLEWAKDVASKSKILQAILGKYTEDLAKNILASAMRLARAITPSLRLGVGRMGASLGIDLGSVAAGYGAGKAALKLVLMAQIPSLRRDILLKHYKDVISRTPGGDKAAEKLFNDIAYGGLYDVQSIPGSPGLSVRVPRNATFMDQLTKRPIAAMRGVSSLEFKNIVRNDPVLQADKTFTPEQLLFGNSSRLKTPGKPFRKAVGGTTWALTTYLLAKTLNNVAGLNKNLLDRNAALDAASIKYPTFE